MDETVRCKEARFREQTILRPGGPTEGKKPCFLLSPAAGAALSKWPLCRVEVPMFTWVAGSSTRVAGSRRPVLETATWGEKVSGLGESPGLARQRPVSLLQEMEAVG